MIKTIKSEAIYNLLVGIPAIAALGTIYSLKPDENATPITNYMFIDIVSNNVSKLSNVGPLMKKARVSFHLVTKKTLLAADTPERVLSGMIDVLNNNLVNQGSIKINGFGGYLIQSIQEDTVSPIFVEDNRYYQTKDYIFTYLCV